MTPYEEAQRIQISRFAEYDNVTSGTAANVIFANGLNIEAQKATRVT